MVDEKVIEIEVTVEGIGGEAMDAERESAMNSIRQLIFDKFFEATFKRDRSSAAAARRTTSSIRSRTFTRTR